MHIIQNIFALGGMNAIKDTVSALIFRTTGISDRYISINSYSFLKGLSSILIKITYSFSEPAIIGFSILILNVIIFILLYKKRLIPNESGKILLILFLASFSWSIIFFQHASEHFHIILHYFPLPQLMLFVNIYYLYKYYQIQKSFKYIFPFQIIILTILFILNINNIIKYQKLSTDWSHFSKIEASQKTIYTNNYKPEIMYYSNKWLKQINSLDSLKILQKGNIFLLDTLYNKTDIPQYYVNKKFYFNKNINQYKVYSF